VVLEDYSVRSNGHGPIGKYVTIAMIPLVLAGGWLARNYFTKSQEPTVQQVELASRGTCDYANYPKGIPVGYVRIPVSGGPALEDLAFLEVSDGTTPGSVKAVCDYVGEGGKPLTVTFPAGTKFAGRSIVSATASNVRTGPLEQKVK
jgi:hypothetical protein